MLPYSKLSRNYNELHYKEQLKKAKFIKEILKIKDESILDVGCGTALYSNLFKNYLGLDNSKEMLKLAKAKTIYGEAENLPFKNNSFDIVISITAIHNFKNIKKSIEEIKRVSKNKIAISVLKKSKKLNEIRRLLKNFKEYEETQDIIFIQTS